MTFSASALFFNHPLQTLIDVFSLKPAQQRALLGGRRMSALALQETGPPGTPRFQAKILSRGQSVFNSSGGG